MRPGPTAFALTLACVSAARAEGVAVPSSSPQELLWAPPSPVPIRGPRYAPITLEVYATFFHPASNTAVDLCRRALARRAGEVRVLFNLTPFGPPGSDLAAEAALEAAAQGRFDAFVDRFFGSRNPPGSSAADITRVGREIGMDADRLAEVLATRSRRAVAEKLGQEARNASHMAAEVLVNGRRLTIYSPDEQLALALREARARADALREAGVPLSQLYERLLEAEQDEPRREANLMRRPERIQWPEESSPARGPSLAPLTLVMYSNIQCAACLDLHLTARKLRERFPGRVRQVWKHWAPVSTGGLETYAAELAAGAAEQGKLFTLLDAMVAIQLRVQRNSRTEVDAAAQQAHIDLQRMARDSRDGRLRTLVERDNSEGRPQRLRFGPLLLLNGQVITSGTSWERVERIALDELSRSLVDRLGERDPKAASPAP